MSSDLAARSADRIAGYYREGIVYQTGIGGIDIAKVNIAQIIDAELAGVREALELAKSRARYINEFTTCDDCNGGYFYSSFTGMYHKVDEPNNCKTCAGTGRVRHNDEASLKLLAALATLDVKEEA